MRRRLLLSPAIALAICLAQAAAKPLDLTLRTRDPQTNRVVVATERVDSAKVGVVVVDPWNYHWCMTACERVAAMTPRWNRALQCARGLGMPVLWAPSDVAGSYAGYPQRERAIGVLLVPVPKLRAMLQPGLFTAPVGPCMCGPGFACIPNYGESDMNPELFLADDDLIVASTEEVYALLKQSGITHVIYMGLHTNMCLFGKPGALKYMVEAGLKCMLARDINDAFTSYHPATGFTPDGGTQQTDEDLQRAGVPTIDVVGEWRKAGVWDDTWTVETVRITPWGKRLRPYFFETSTTATLTAPWLDGVKIRYTLDGAAPGANSPRYEKPLVLSRTVELRAAAFRDGKQASLTSDAYFVRLPPKPPEPDVPLDTLAPIVDPYAACGPEYAAFLFTPRPGASYDGKPLRIRGRRYSSGLGFLAPGAARFALKPEYKRFVGLVGIADNMVDEAMARHKALHCSVVFRVFVDGRMLAESPVLRISQEPWRFDVKLPEGGRHLRVACMDAGSRSAYDLGNCVEAGFVLVEGEAKRQAVAARRRGPWTPIPVPGYWEQARGGQWASYDGLAWYRCYVKPPRGWAGRDVTLHVECVDNRHETFVNGRKVGVGVLDQTDYCRVKLNRTDLRLGEYNLVAIRVEDVGGAGGFSKLSPALFCGEEAIELRGEWEFRTGDDPEWAAWPAGSQPPRHARYEKVAAARDVPRQTGVK